MKSRTRAGVIGLGIIGSRVAECLRKAGFRVYVWSRTPRPEPNFLGSAAEVADAAEVIQLFVSNEKALLEVVDAMVPSIRPRHVILNHSTVAPEHVREAARRVEAKGGAFLDAPFTGSKEAAGEARLAYYIGGDEKSLAKARHVLEASSRAILPVGGIGDASLLKLATNIITASTVQVLAEALALTVKAGIPAEKLAEALTINAAKSGVVDLKLPKMISGDYSPHFSLKHMFKDVAFANHLAGELGLELPLTSCVGGLLLDGLHQGWGDDDFASLARHYGFDPAGGMPAENAGDPDAPAQSDTPGANAPA